MTPDVSIVVAAWQAEATLPALLAACAAQDFPGRIETIVVDDGSTDGTARVAEAGGARVVRQANAGPAAARNRGWRAAAAPVVLFTDSDCVPRPDWVRRLVAAIGAETPVAGGSYGIANPGHLLADTVHAEIVWRHARMPAEVEFAGSFNLGATRAALESVGGFDERFPAPSGEDNDLSYRLRDAGHRIAFVPQARVDHRHPTSWRRYLREQMRHGEWRVVLYARHPGRARGDGYAGLPDLAAPPLAALSVLLLAASPWRPDLAALAALAFSLVALFHLVLAVRVAVHARSTAPLALAALGTLRAYARAAGLAKGLVRVATGRTRAPGRAAR